MVKLKPYIASQKVGKNGLFFLGAYSVFGGAAIGGIFWYISLLIYIPLFFPLFMGFLGMFFMNQAIRQGKIRNYQVASLFAPVAALSIMGTLHYLDYLQFQRLAEREIINRSRGGNFVAMPGRGFQRVGTSEQRHQVIQQFLERETGSSGMWGYLKLQAQEGVELEFRARGSSSATPINLGTAGTWIYWVVELGIVTFICLVGGTEAVAVPFCERSQKWYGKAQRIGHVSTESAVVFLKHFQKGSLAAAGALAKPQPELEPHVGLAIDLRCSPSIKDADRMLIVETISYDGKGRQQKRTVLKGMISMQDLRPFEEAIADISKQQSVASAEPTVVPEQPTERPMLPVEVTPPVEPELTDVRASDRFERHDLKKLQLQQISRQLLEYPQIEKAYLIRKVAGEHPERSLYVLGISIHQELQYSRDDEEGLVERLAKELHIPRQLWVFSLSLNSEIAAVVEKIDGVPFYKSPSYQRA